MDEILPHSFSFFSENKTTFVAKIKNKLNKFVSKKDSFPNNEKKIFLFILVPQVLRNLNSSFIFLKKVWWIEKKVVFLQHVSYAAAWR